MIDAILDQLIRAVLEFAVLKDWPAPCRGQHVLHARIAECGLGKAKEAHNACGSRLLFAVVC